MPKESVANKVALADCVVLGKVTAIEAGPVQGQVWRYSALPKWDFTIVEVEIAEPLFGAKGVKRARFGFIGSLEKNVQYQPAPAVGRSGCFFGVKVGNNDFYVVPRFCYHDQKAPGFADDLALARRAGRLLAKPTEGLKSKDPDERVSAAYLLILRSLFAPFRHGETGKSVPIDAEQSKLALLALAKADWKKHGKEVRVALNWLNWGAKYGAPMPSGLPLDQGDPKWPTAAQEWLRENADSFRIHRLVKAEPAKK
jgi:hypothetical protein